MSNEFSEDTRVKLPALIHLTRLGYKYFSLKEKLRQIKKELNELIERGALSKKELYAHERFCEPMLDYILGDFKDSRVRFGDKSIGAMVVCDSSEQARMFYDLFQRRFNVETRHASSQLCETKHGYLRAAELSIPYYTKNRLSAALILHNEGDKESRAVQISDFKDGKIDFLFVYSMLLTGFDAPRLKKMYLGRKIKAHNLLQTLTREIVPTKISVWDMWLILPISAKNLSRHYQTID